MDGSESALDGAAAASISAGELALYGDVVARIKRSLADSLGTVVTNTEVGDANTEEDVADSAGRDRRLALVNKGTVVGDDVGPLVDSDAFAVAADGGEVTNNLRESSIAVKLKASEVVDNFEAVDLVARLVVDLDIPGVDLGETSYTGGSADINEGLGDLNIARGLGALGTTGLSRSTAAGFYNAATSTGLDTVNSSAVFRDFA